MKIIKILSGGQTGADRAALDAAIACGVPHGGWCPKGRRAEDGTIPLSYKLRETNSEEYPVRTRANVAAADMTLILSRGSLSGGSLLTQEFAVELDKPCMHVDLLQESELFQCLENFCLVFPNIGKPVLNVAGPRASNDPEIYDAVYEAMIRFLRRL